MTSQEHGIEQIRRLSRQAERRIRLDRALRVGAKALCAALVVAVADVAARKVGVVPERAARRRARPGGARRRWWPPAWRGRGACRSGPARAVSIDSTRSTTASPTRSRSPRPTARTPFMDAAIEDAVARRADRATRASPCPSPGRATPRSPPALAASLVGGLALRGARARAASRTRRRSTRWRWPPTISTT